MKSLVTACGVLAILLIGLLFCRRPPPVQQQQQQPPPVVVTSDGPTIERLERLSNLVTSRVYIADVLIGEGDGCRGAWLVRGDALIAVNLSQAEITEKDESAKRAKIRLPQPIVLIARVDHERTRTWEVSRMTWLPWNANQDRLRDEVMLQAQRLVTQAAGSKENIEQAKRSAEIILSSLFEQLGWEVKVVW